MEHIHDMAIIGGGPAGYTAALYAARAGIDVVVIEKMSVGGQMIYAGNVENYPGFENGINGFNLGEKMQKCAEQVGAKTEYAEVLSVNFDGVIKEAQTNDGKVSARTFIIASGAYPKKLGIENEDKFVGKGVHYCAHCDGRFYKNKTVAVVGGGNSAVQEALYLSGIAERVYIIHRDDTVKASRAIYEPLSNTSNAEFILNSVVTAFNGDERLTGIKVKNVKNGEESVIDCDGIFIAIGRAPATEFLRGSVELDKNGYIIADESTRTSIYGVFAAGDVRTKAMRQIITAASDGAVAVHFAEEYLAANNLKSQN